MENTEAHERCNTLLFFFPLKALFDPRKISECYKKVILVMHGLRLDILSLNCMSAKSFKRGWNKQQCGTNTNKHAQRTELLAPPV